MEKSEIRSQKLAIGYWLLAVGKKKLENRKLKAKNDYQ
jgi:hypothetical protein